MFIEFIETQGGTDSAIDVYRAGLVEMHVHRPPESGAVGFIKIKEIQNYAWNCHGRLLKLKGYSGPQIKLNSEQREALTSLFEKLGITNGVLP